MKQFIHKNNNSAKIGLSQIMLKSIVLIFVFVGCLSISSAKESANGEKNLAAKTNANKKASKDTDKKTNKKILIYTKNGKGYIHNNIPASVEAIKGICKKNGWGFQVSDDPSIFTAKKIDEFDALVFSNTNNETFDTEKEKQVFKKYIQNGGGFVGIHSACGSERQWPWFCANLGGKFVRHASGLQDFDLKVIDNKHPSTEFLDSVWKWKSDECYYLDHLNPDIHVLLAVVLDTVKDSGKAEYPGKIFGDYFPLAWCHEFDGGRQWYTALGHSIWHYKDPAFIKHIEGGIRWAMKKNKQ